MPDTPFIITVDTEGDNLWARPRTITTRNAGFLPRFQRLCERYGFKPVYLTNYEMAESEEFTEFARDLLARGTGEVGMHLHAWNSPPLLPLTMDDFRCQPYLTEFPDSTMREKVRRMTHLLEERFNRKMISHRGGRWAFDARYAAVLLAEGYRVDCSVTPGIDWRASPGAAVGGGGPDFRAYPRRPYFLSATDIATPAAQGLLEVPMTVCTSAVAARLPWLYAVPFVRRLANRVSPAFSWLCPVQPTLTGNVVRHLEVMLGVARAARVRRPTHLEFMVHSSELMPGGNPTFRSNADIETLYEYLGRLFEEVAKWTRGVTLAEFCDEYGAGGASVEPLRQGRPEHRAGELRSSSMARC